MNFRCITSVSLFQQVLSNFIIQIGQKSVIQIYIWQKTVYKQQVKIKIQWNELNFLGNRQQNTQIRKLLGKHWKQYLKCRRNIISWRTVLEKGSQRISIRKIYNREMESGLNTAQSTTFHHMAWSFYFEHRSNFFSLAFQKLLNRVHNRWMYTDRQ